MNEEDRNKAERFSRIRRVKRLLRHLPRKANIHRYPVLKWFKESARRRSYLWSFRREEMIPAFYAGWIITLLPLYGLQILLGFFAALVLRANLMVITALQLVSNPLTVLPLWYLNYWIGNKILNLFMDESPVRYGRLIEEASELGLNFRETFSFILERTREAGASVVVDLLGRLVGGTFFGGVVLGVVAGYISVLVYKLILKRYTPKYATVSGEALRNHPPENHKK